MAVVIGTLYPVLRSPGLGGTVFSDFLTAPTWVDVVALTAATAASYTLQTTANIFRVTSTVVATYGNFNGTAVTPSANVVNGTASFPIVGQALLIRPPGVTVLSLINAATAVVVIESWN
jgi:hypothetical protein